MAVARSGGSSVKPIILGISVALLVYFSVFDFAKRPVATRPAEDQMNAAWENLVAAASESNAPAAVPITKQPPPPTPAAVQSIVAPASPAPSSQAPAPAAPQQQQPATSVSFTPEGLPRFGFYLPVWNQIPSVLGVLKATRKFYPESPIYVLQDGGNIDFGPVCAMPKYRCIFQRGKGENSRWNPHSWFHRITQAALILGTEFVIYLEPDVKVARRHLVDPKHDAGGIFDNFNPEVGDETRNYLERLGRDRNPCFKATWHWFGLAGGSYFRTEAIMDAFAPEHIKRLDWAGLAPKEGDKTMSSDFAMMVALYARGWTVYPWEETAQNMRGRGLPRGEAARKKFRAEFPAYNPEAAFTHNQKEHYGDVVPEEENKIIGPFPDLWEDTTCHGCVWFEEGDPSKPVKIPSKPPPPMDNERYSFPYSKDLVKECTAEERAAAVTKPPRPASPAQIALAAQVLQGLRNPAATAAGPGGSVPPPLPPAAAAPPPAAPPPPQQASGGSEEPAAKPPVYVLHADKNGLPISNDPRPSWLIKADELVLDARKQASGGILMIQPVLMDASGDWGKKKQDRPRWLRAILATNRNHARLWGHAMIIRWQPTMPQLTGWQKAQCGRKTTEKVCTKNNERENFNWEKHLMLQEYLQSPQKFEFVLMLDADAAIVKHRVNVLGQIATRMKADGLDVFLTNEDWLQNGERRINGGLIMSKNTVWTNDLFTDTFDAHLKGPRGLNVWRIGLRGQQCSSNEQICLNDVLWGPGKELVKNRMLLVSGVRYNRGGCTVRHCGEPISDQTMETLKMKDERLEVLHFMGGSKGLAPEALCDGEVDYTGDGPDGYGCKEK